MGLKLTVGICRKVGRPDYGSAGAECHLELEVAASPLADPAGFRAEVQAAYDLVTQLVTDQLTEQALSAADVPPEDRRERGLSNGAENIHGNIQAREPAPTSQARADRTDGRGVYHAPVESNYRPDGRGRGGVERRNRPGLPPASREPEREREPQRNGTNGEAPRKRFEGKPRNGSQLFAYLKDREPGCPGLVKAVQAWGKSYQFPWKFSEWNEAEVRDGLEEAERLQEEGRDR